MNIDQILTIISKKNRSDILPIGDSFNEEQKEIIKKINTSLASIEYQSFNRSQTELSKDVRYLVSLYETYAAKCSAEKTYFEQKLTDLFQAEVDLNSCKIEMQSYVNQINRIDNSINLDNKIIESLSMQKAQIQNSINQCYSDSVYKDLNSHVYSQNCTTSWWAGREADGDFVKDNGKSGFHPIYLHRPFREGIGRSAQAIWEWDFNSRKNSLYTELNRVDSHISQKQIELQKYDFEKPNLKDIITLCAKKIDAINRKILKLLNENVFIDSLTRYKFCYDLSVASQRAYLRAFSNIVEPAEPKIVDHLLTEVDEFEASNDILKSLHTHHKYLSIFDMLTSRFSWATYTKILNVSDIRKDNTFQFQFPDFKCLWINQVEIVSKELADFQIVLKLNSSPSFKLVVGSPRFAEEAAQSQDPQHWIRGYNPKDIWTIDVPANVPKTAQIFVKVVVGQM